MSNSRLQNSLRSSYRALLLFAVFVACLWFLPNAALAQAGTPTPSLTTTPVPTPTPALHVVRDPSFWSSGSGIAVFVVVAVVLGVIIGSLWKGGQDNWLTKLFSDFTNALAYCVVFLAFIGIVFLSWIVLDAKRDLQTAQYVFSAVLPLLGTWVGTVLAHYFQKENLTAATQSITTLVSKVTGTEKLQSIPVKTVMIRPDRIKTLPAEKKDEDYKLAELAKYIRDNGIDRVPIFKDNKLKGPISRVVHLSLIDRFIAQKATPGQPAPDLTLADLTADAQLGTVVRGSFAVVKSDATLADAKNAMDKASNALGSAGNCYDVFVTDTGSSDDPVVGWITNDIINDNAKV